MATYIQGVTDYIPQIQPFSPDYNFYSGVLQFKQSKHDAARKQISTLYGSLLNAPLTRDDNQAMGYIGLQTTLDPSQLEEYTAIEKYSFTQSFFMSIEETNRMIGLTLNMLGKMVTGQISSDNLSGPVGIAKDAGTVAKRGLIATLSFMAIISISLGILNLLPIPVLDGGQILFVCIETVIRRPLPEKIQMAFQQIGVTALLFLMVFALYNDLARIFG